jgi:hypothetical protein
MYVIEWMSELWVGRTIFGVRGGDERSKNNSLRDHCDELNGSRV